MRFSPAIALLVTAVALTLGAAPARAQDLTLERVQFALDVTDRRIEQAQLLVSDSRNERARPELDAATSIQDRAKSAFAAQQLGMALRLTLEARGHADRAIAIVKGLPDPDRVLAQLERTRETLERVRQRIEECDKDRAHALLRVAFSMQERAESAADAGRFLAALQLTMGARERAFKALRLCHLEDNLRESAEQALRRTDDLLSRARDIVAERRTEQAREAFAQAVEVQGRATDEFRAGRYEASQRFTQAARAMAHRAIRLSGGR